MKTDITILWADDEIDMLKPQILFLEEKGYHVEGVSNGQDAVEKCTDPDIDVIFLDEGMPGLSGLETLSLIKDKRPSVPIVMITKNETEGLMEEAIGSQISDYLIKPVKSQQILLTLKKIIDNKRLVSEKTDSNYQKDFQKIFFTLQDNLDHEQWFDIYKKLVHWEIQLDKTGATNMKEVLTSQKAEANVEFGKFIDRNYLNWLSGKTSAPIMSHTVMKEKVFPLLSDTIPTFFILIDNLRFDQWKIIEPLISESFKLKSEDHFYSILPTATQYARNAIFAGLLPSEIEKRLPNLWLNDEDEGGKNLQEPEFLKDNIVRNRLSIKYSYHKILNHSEGKNLEDNILNLMTNDLNVIVYNFVDMLSHARTEMEVLKELASDETAYRSLTRSWFDHSPLYNALRKLADKKIRLIITTDHGTIRVNTPSKVLADRNATTNLRYKSGKNLQYNKKDVFEVKVPVDAGLPKQHISSTFIFAKEDCFFAYPNNYNHYVNYFKNTFQHGGVSLEEMVVPFAVFESF
ncbi:MAG: PglZ domain-containing protein [Chitinophagales bacterium]|jgi:DNA-binding response OmpR family regulator|nr:PglZ domain-containing protein [Bacteroidota bacterium]MBK7568524.1 PglZ domain-containing protein [Bacteroidota bacterium]MBP8915345.1 PglZ domain-containing protein [Chitinophagales bacterium]MBP9220562.1 PglZ domain-containing protein [Chitinophagales bacterium]MBP9794820.1 PglZ domain-containing protein [Chitinophagales bacterium]